MLPDTSVRRFTRAIVRPPGCSFVHGLTTAGLGLPDYENALRQHADYCDALRSCGLEVIALPADEAFPDSTFVEDTALLTPACAIILRPGAPSRQREIDSIEPVVRKFFASVERIDFPGTVDGGDIMMAGSRYFIGLSQRTNQIGAAQLTSILARHRLSASTVPLHDVLHLKSAASFLEHNTMAATDEIAVHPGFDSFRKVRIEPAEQYAANCLWINGTVLVADGYPKAAESLAAAGYRIITLDMSEFRKLDGGLSCLSLRF